MSAQENLFDDVDSSFEEGSAPTTTSHTLLETRSNFLPWHKPRKQWMRVRQWAHPIAKLVDSLKLKDLHEPLRYLSLPGPDLLDVRTIRPLCAERNIQLQFVGLNGGDDDSDVARTRALESQVRALPGIHPGSEVVKDRFEQIGVKNSVAYARVITAQQSFDVINVDLCGSFAESIPAASSDTVPSALFALLQHQARTRSRDWLLFITTRSDSQAVKSETMAQFVNYLNSVILKDSSVKSKLLELNLMLASEFEGDQIMQDRLSPQSHSNAFAIGFGHWMLSGLANENPPWRADMLEHVEYHVSFSDSACDMVSLGFWCKKLNVQNTPDVFGIAKPISGGQSPVDEVKRICEEKIHRRVSDRLDIDKSLHLNPADYNFALEESAKLLVSAMYDETAYRAWAEEQRIKMEQFLVSSGLVSQ
jgi:hypothetical protein